MAQFVGGGEGWEEAEGASDEGECLWKLTEVEEVFDTCCYEVVGNRGSGREIQGVLEGGEVEWWWDDGTAHFM